MEAPRQKIVSESHTESYQKSDILHLKSGPPRE